MDAAPTFGMLLRRLRKGHDLSQEALAQRANCAYDTIKKFERGLRRPSRELATHLADLFALEGSERERFLAAARAPLATGDALAEALAISPTPASFSRLPRPTSPLLGREAQLADAADLLRRHDVRLVTLTGPGGTGKTRLAQAIAVACAESGDFPAGVGFVELAPIADPQLVAAQIAHTLALHNTEKHALSASITYELQGRPGLLILDNFEHVLPARRLIAQLLADVAGLTILVTSRTTLRLSGEHELVVPPLQLPKRTTDIPPDLLGQYPAIQLFVARVQALQPAFTLDATNAPSIAAICRCLDGLPLAIELAAARSKLFSPSALLERLESPLRFLTTSVHDLPARQQTLRATIDWSYRLLNPGERRLFTALAVFVGGTTVAAVEAVCADADGEVVDTLQALIDHSLVRLIRMDDGEDRVLLLETIRAYALEQLALDDAGEALRQRHAQYYLGLAEAADEAGDADWSIWNRRLEAESANFHAAFQWSQQDHVDPAIGLRLVSALNTLWYTPARWIEGRAWAQQALARAAHHTVDALILARTQYVAGAILNPHSEQAAMRALLVPAISTFRAAGATKWLGRTLLELGRAMTHGSVVTGNHVAIGDVRAHLEEACTLLRANGEHWRLALGLYTLGGLANLQGRPEEAQALIEEGLAIGRTLKHGSALRWGLHNLAAFHISRGEFPAARAVISEQRSLYQAEGNYIDIGYVNINVGFMAWQQGAVDTVEEMFLGTVRVLGALDEPWEYIWCHNHLAWVAWARGDLAQAEDYYRRGLNRALADEIDGGVAWCTSGLGLVAMQRGDLAAAEACFSQALAIFRTGVVPFDIAYTLNYLGRVVLKQGDSSHATALFQEAIRTVQSIPGRWNIALALEGLAEIAVAEGHPTQAVRLLAGADELRTAMEAPHWPPFAAAHAGLIADLRAELGETAFAAAWERGRQLDGWATSDSLWQALAELE